MRLRSPPLLPSFFLSLALLSCGGAPTPPVVGAVPTGPMTQAPPGFWDHWGDGRAELAGYRLTQPRYGEQRHGEAILITVTEDFTAAQRVKSDGGHGDEYPVLKLNEVRDFQTGFYDYNVMTSTFLRLDGRIPLGLPDKVTFSMQEWCGHVYEELSVSGSEMTRQISSYFDGESAARSVSPIPARGVTADAMPLLVRGLVGELLAPGQVLTVPWLPSASERRMAHRPFAWGSATLTRSGAAARVEVPAGAFDAFTIQAEIEGGGSIVWTVEAAAPHRLLRWERDDGEVGTLTGVVRRTYWRENHEGEEVLRAELGLPVRPGTPGNEGAAP